MLEQDTLSYTKLKLSLELPDLEETWLDGYESAIHGGLEESNPYSLASAEYEHWNEGWWAGYFDEEKLFHWCDTPVIKNVAEVINRIQQSSENAVIVTPIAAYTSPTRITVVMSYVVRLMGTVLAFGICYQFADILA